MQIGAAIFLKLRCRSGRIALPGIFIVPALYNGHEVRCRGRAPVILQRYTDFAVIGLGCGNHCINVLISGQTD